MAALDQSCAIMPGGGGVVDRSRTSTPACSRARISRQKKYVSGRGTAAQDSRVLAAKSWECCPLLPLAR